MLLQQLSLSAINFNDDSYRITYAPSLSTLIQSIKAVGLAQPLVVRHTQEGTYQIISGYKRYLALKELGKTTALCVIYEAQEITPGQAFMLNLHDNALGRPLNLIEKCQALIKLQQFSNLPEHDVVDQILPLLGEVPSYKIYHQIVALQELTEPMKRYMLEHDVARETAHRIAEFTPSTQQALLGMLQHISCSSAKLNELLTLIREISARDGLTVEDILARYQLLEIVANPVANPLERVKALRETLRGIRLPKLTERQRQLAQLIQGLELPTTAKLHADPYFENDKMKLEYQFSHPEELDELMKRIQQAFQKQRWHQIFDWYRS